VGVIPLKKEEKKLLKIGDLAKSGGVTVRTVRYYEELGLLKPSEITEGGFRLFTEHDIKKLQFIKRFKELEFPLEEIKRLLETAGKGKDKQQKISGSSNLLQKQLAEVENRIGEFENLKENILEAMSMLESCKKCKEEKCPSICPNQKAIY